MIRLHAGFSAAAAAFALAAAAVAALADPQAAYAAMAGAYALLSAALARAPLPPHEEGAVAAGAGAVSVVPAGEAAATGGRLSLLRVPGVAVATAICTLCFFGDGAIEGFSALLLRSDQGAGTFGAGLSIAAFHAASLAGRLVFAPVTDARGERFVLTFSGALAAAAMAALVTAGSPVLGGAALLLVGFALAPVIPTVLSLAGRSAPAGRAGAAVSLVTTVGYSAFVLGPPAVGALAQATSLRAALSLVILTTAAFSLTAATRCPTSRPPAREPATPA
jgi:predicted MFS family arabinose efflux permease